MTGHVGLVYPSWCRFSKLYREPVVCDVYVLVGRDTRQPRSWVELIT